MVPVLLVFEVHLRDDRDENIDELESGSVLGPCLGEKMVDSLWIEGF